MNTYIFSYRSKEAWTLLKRSPNAFILLWVVAQRAKREDDPVSELDIGEAYLGDYKEYGMSKQNYRTAKKLLEKLKFLTLKITPNGTTAKLINTSIFDNNMIIPNTLTNIRVTPGQHLPNTCLTPNNKIISKEVKNDKKNDMSSEAKEVLNYLNQINKKRYTNPGLIQARLNEGITVEQCKLVIDIKSKDKYFIDNGHNNPTTLFRPANFDKYINAIPPEPESQRNYIDMTKLKDNK